MDIEEEAVPVHRMNFNKISGEKFLKSREKDPHPDIRGLT